MELNQSSESIPRFILKSRLRIAADVWHLRVASCRQKASKQTFTKFVIDNEYSGLLWFQFAIMCTPMESWTSMVFHRYHRRSQCSVSIRLQYPLYNDNKIQGLKLLSKAGKHGNDLWRMWTPNTISSVSDKQRTCYC